MRFAFAAFLAGKNLSGLPHEATAVDQDPLNLSL